jgi:CDP-diglyceride synthetase
MGVAWIALGLGHLLLLRDFPEHGRLAVFTVLLAVFADDTARLSDRAPARPPQAGARRSHPGKTWEGFVAGTLAAIAVAFFALYEQDFLSIPESIALGARSHSPGPLATCRVGDQARPAGEGLGPVARRPRRHARPDRLALFASVAAFYVVLALA